MSQHDIEDLVEATIRLVLASDETEERKRSLIDGLWRFQYRHDTSDTTGRLTSELSALKFVQDKDYSPPPFLALVATVMAQAKKTGDLQLAHHWFAKLVDGIAEHDLTDLLPGTFGDLLASSDAHLIRDIAIRAALPKLKFKDGYFKLPSWTNARSFTRPSKPAEIEHHAILRFFADTTTDIPKIEAERAKLYKEIAAFDDSALHRLPQLVELPLGVTYVGRAQKSDYRYFIFDVDDGAPPEGGRIRFEIDHVQDIGILAARFTIRSPQIERWQGADGKPTPHFAYNYFFCVPQKDIENSKDIHHFGGWSYRLNQSEAVLRKRLENLFSFWKLSKRVRKFHAAPLSEFLNEQGIDKILKDGAKIANRWGFFRTDIETMFAFACLGIERGEDVSDVLKRIDARLETINPRNANLTMWRDGAARLHKGDIWFPAELSAIIPAPTELTP